MTKGYSPSGTVATIQPEDSVELPVPLTHHPDYYFDDGNLVILVEYTLFNVHKSTFTRHSRVFQDIFALPLPKPSSSLMPVVDGATDDCPLRFQGISCVDFERLLWILYPPVFGVHKPNTAEEWTSVLHLSTRWEFDSIRSLSIRELEHYDLNAVHKVTLSQQFNIQSQWTLKAYTELCQRPEPLTIHDARSIGLETAVRVSELREQLRHNYGSRSGSLHRSGSSPRRARPTSPSRDAIRPSLEGRRMRSQSIRYPRHPDPARLIAEAFELDIGG